jgi:hypothetical protein
MKCSRVADMLGLVSKTGSDRSRSSVSNIGTRRGPMWMHAVHIDPKLAKHLASQRNNGPTRGGAPLIQLIHAARHVDGGLEQM